MIELEEARKFIFSRCLKLSTDEVDISKSRGLVLAETVISNDDVVIEAARVEHVQPYLDSLAYRVNYNQGSIVFSGDTRPCQSLIDLAKNADVLVMECIRLHKDMKDNITSECESSAQAAGEVANSAGVKMLVLTHQSPDLDQPFKKEQVIKEVQKSYDGQIEWAVELDQICYEC